MMQYDYYAYKKWQLSDPLHNLKQAVAEFKQASEKIKQAKKQKDKNAQQQAEQEQRKAKQRIETSAKESVQIEPHLAYLWFVAKKEENDKKAKLNTESAAYVRDTWQKQLTANFIPSEFQFLPKFFDLNHLPSLSFMLRIPFKLRKPYLSKDDRAFHLLDHPVRKDKVFQTPMVAPSSWKGALHSAMLQKLVEWWSGLDETRKSDRNHKKQFVARRIGIAKLFGTEKGTEIDSQEFEGYLDNFSDDHSARWYRRYVRRYLSKTGFFSGRLYFYPTFFNKIGLEVINPHDCKTGAGKNPILIESVPIGATGEFVLLYVPLGEVQASEVAEDLKGVIEGVRDMLTVYGFGAKTSSGFGVAEPNDKIELGIRADWSWSTPSATEVKTPEPELPRYLIAPGQLHPDFLDSDGNFKSEIEYLQGKSAKKAKQLYQKAKDWWEREGR
ncbi:MAG: hypothetical protein N2235_09790 [Fischerella sp.]|nr:hypothetical protein [Fischerella sp.]